MTGTALPPVMSFSGDGILTVKQDGSVIGSGQAGYASAKWKNIDSVWDNISGAFGVREDGTVAVYAESWANEEWLQSTVGKWTDISAVTPYLNSHMAGLRRDGTVVMAENFDQKNYKGNAHLQTAKWTDIVDLETGIYWTSEFSETEVREEVPYTIGIKNDGTLIFACEEEIFPEARTWTDITAITVSGNHLVGLKADGTVVADGETDLKYWPEEYREGIETTLTEIKTWTEIQQLEYGETFAVGLKTNGTVVIAQQGYPRRQEPGWREKVAGWKDIVQINCNGNYVLGLKEDGTMMVAQISLYDSNLANKPTDQKPWKGVKVPTWEPEKGN